MASKPVQIGALSFAKKGDAHAHFQALLYRYDVGAVIPEPGATELTWLIERHSEADTKIGVGLKEFSSRNAMYGTRCFEIRRTDGTTTDFSFRQCVDGKAPSAFAEALRAFRIEVAEEIKQKKWSFFRASTYPGQKVPCAATGRLLTLDEATIEHVPPNTFKVLVERFLAQRGVAASNSLVTPPRDNQYTPRLVDRAIAEAWRAYYDLNASLRIVGN